MPGDTEPRVLRMRLCEPGIHSIARAGKVGPAVDSGARARQAAAVHIRIAVAAGLVALSTWSLAGQAGTTLIGYCVGLKGLE